MDNSDKRLSDGQMVLTGLFVAAPMMLFALGWMALTLPAAIATEMVRGVRGPKDKAP